MYEISFLLPRLLKCETKFGNKDRIYCHVCVVGCVAKYQARRKLEKISDNANFKVYAAKKKNKNHEYNKVFGFLDWENSDEKLVHKSCKGTSFKDSYLNWQPLIPSTPKGSEALLTPDISSTDQS